jgi:DNA helicase-2/ATP-dependent DNA helicase PcrA
MDPINNVSQQEAIHAKGPTLVIAGPGTGKTFTIIQRVLHLIRDEKVKPEEIMIVTYTVKASKELITRLTNELSRQGIEVNLHEMYIGTFHHICRRLLKEFREYTRLERNYIETDQFEQQYLVYEHLDEFESIDHFEDVVPSSWIKMSTGEEIRISPWRRCRRICEYVNRLSEELMNPEELLQSGEIKEQVLGRMMMKYDKLAKTKNFLDFTRLQTEAYYILSEKKNVLRRVRDRVRYILVDEYQDTNYIQEKLVQLLSGDDGEVFVVGDDDQSIYRFRGATVKNILLFQRHYGAICHVIKLNTNYRSNQGIVEFCMKWMALPRWFNWERNGTLYRYQKGRVHSAEGPVESPSVVRITAENNEPNFQKKVCDFIEKLKEEGCITDYNQVAILFDSVKGDISTRLQYALQHRGIPVYAPRSGHFFERKEVAWFFGSLLYLFPKIMDRMKRTHVLSETENIEEKYLTFLSMTKVMLDGNRELKEWLEKTGKEIEKSKQLPSGLLSLAYDILCHKPFTDILDAAAEGESREARNLSAITRLISRYDCFIEENHGYGRETVEDMFQFFARYLRLWFENGVGEYEDEEAYAPSGQVSFLNIHQSKGLEYPVVISASLQEYPRGEDSLISDVVTHITGRSSYEPKKDIKDFDFRRKYYTAFSRAETLLVLACNKKPGKVPSREFMGPLESLPEWDDPSVDFTKLHFQPVERTHFKPRFSFTSQVALYEDCPRKYKFTKVYRFAPILGKGLLYGTLVHETIEDIHRAALRGETDALTPANIYAWMMADYQGLAKAENTWLPRAELDQAFQEILGYVSFRRGDWSMIREAEYPLELVKEDYIMDGTIDLLQEQDGSVDVIDFKTGAKPSPESRLMKRYTSQLQIYAYLVEQKMGKPVGNLLLYFTGDEENPLYPVPGNDFEVEKRIKAFDETAGHILSEDFNHRAERKGKEMPEPCRHCEWRKYCWKEE